MTATPNVKATKTENEILDTTHFVDTPKFNKSSAIYFNAKIGEVTKNLAS